MYSLSVFSSIPASASSVTLLEANPKRKGASIVNTSSAILYIRMDGGTATTTTGFNVRLEQNSYFEIPFGYTGKITGIWASASGGAANTVEYFSSYWPFP